MKTKTSLAVPAMARASASGSVWAEPSSVARIPRLSRAAHWSHSSDQRGL
jgi:hypothetical protein